MGGYFTTWRRKIGVATLVMACLFTGAWIRSRSYADFVTPYRSVGVCHFLVSAEGNLKWITSIKRKESIFNDAPPLCSLSSPVNQFPDSELEPIFGEQDPESQPEWQWQSKSFGFHFGNCRVDAFDVRLRRIPYWPVVIPLTLLSAWLLLSRPRTKKPAE